MQHLGVFFYSCGEMPSSSSSREKGSMISSDMMTVSKFRTSPSSLAALFGAASLWVTTRPESCTTHISFIAVVEAARS